MSVPAEPTLDPEERRAFERGLAEFNGGYFFECHDTLEELWRGIRGPSRDFFQGLIQVAVAFYHLTNGNPAGAESLLGRALRRFEPYGERYFGFDLAAHRAELASWRERIRTGTAGTPDLGALPKWRFAHEPDSRKL